jgi:DNA-directed RNA polymerase specialized sigma24 family protein
MLPHTDAVLARLPLPRVVERCRQESARYSEAATSDPRFCFEVFRRAIVERNDLAWEALVHQYTQYSPVVRYWVESHPYFRSTYEDADYFVNTAFARFWSALTPAKFDRFDSLPAVLRYLKMCVNSAITDYLRTQHRDSELTEETRDAPVPAPRAGGDAELWQMIGRGLNDDRERTALYCRYVLEMKPADISAAYPALFADVREVYKVLQNVLKRLRRDAELRNYHSLAAEIEH